MFQVQPQSCAEGRIASRPAGRAPLQHLLRMRGWGGGPTVGSRQVEPAPGMGKTATGGILVRVEGDSTNGELALCFERAENPGMQTVGREMWCTTTSSSTTSTTTNGPTPGLLL